MAAPYYRIKMRNIPDAETCIRSMHREARGLASRYPTMTAFHFDLASDGPQCEAHVDIRFPQHQVIVNATAAMTERAVEDVMAKAAGELARLERRDPSVAPQPRAKAA